MKIKLLLLGLLSFFMYPALSANDEVNPKKAYSQLKEDKAIFIDVREKGEIADGMIKEAKWIPLSKIKNDQKENRDWSKQFKKMAKNKNIYLYCRSGGRAGQVKKMLKEEGIDAHNIGGYITLQHKLPTQK